MFARLIPGGLSPMNLIAGLAIAMFAGAFGWNMTHPQTSIYTQERASMPGVDRAIAQADETALFAIATDTATSTTPLGDAITARFGMAYASLTQQGDVNTDTVAAAADIRPAISYPTYADSDIAVDADTSLGRVIRWRSDLRVALAPLMQNTTPELDLYAQYVDTKDPSYLTQLHAVASNYRAAVQAAAKIVAPRDAVHYQVGILNAMSSFAAALDALANNVGDPVGSLALLRTYNTAEDAMLTSFDALGRYAAAKTQ